jgi:hypothetical protein
VAEYVGTFCAHTTEMLKHLADRDELIKLHRDSLERLLSSSPKFIGFIVTVCDEDGLKLATTNPCSTPTEAFAEARKIVDNKIEGPRKKLKVVNVRF